MKQLITLGFGLLFGFISIFSFAEQPLSQTNVPLDQPQITNQIAKPIPDNALNTHLVNINTASAGEIQDKLLGIGGKKAQAIVDYREKNGKFMSLEQLTEVSGIGKATLEKNRDRIILE